MTHSSVLQESHMALNNCKY